MGEQATLTVKVGASRGKVFTLTEDDAFYVGRDSKCQYCIPSGQVSRLHCKFEGRRGAWSVRDLDSRHGTVVNGEKVSSRVLRPGDVITVGGNRLRFDVSEAGVGMEAYGAGPADSAAETRADDGAEGAAGFEVLAPQAKEAEEGAGEEADEGGAFVLRIVDPDSELGVFVFSEEERALRGQTFGPYRLIEPMGRGRRCVIFKAEHEENGTIVAVKMLRPSSGDDVKVKCWFVKGATRSGQARHENVVRILSGGRQGDMVFLALEYMACNSFQRFRDALAQGLDGVRRALQATTTICRALEYGYREGRLLHGGVRPSKALFNDAGRAKLSGLGFNNKPASVRAGSFDALRPFTAPEVVDDRGAVALRTDLYGLGATFYYMLTGTPPERDNRNRTPSPKERNPLTPDSLVRILEKMLAPSPSDRYENYSQLLHDLRWALRGEVWHRG